MKKFLSIALALLMLAVMLPVVALADEPSSSSGSIQGTIINHAPAAVSVELEKVTFTKSVAVELYSDDTLLTTATLNTDKLKAGSYDVLTCCIATGTADKCWPLTPWTPRDNVVPDKAVLFVDGNKMDTMKFDLDAAKWAALPGTVLPCSIESAIITSQAGGYLKNAVSVELLDITFTESVAVKLYSDDTLLTTATLNTGKLETGSHDFVTCCIATETADEYWALTPWTPKDDVIPNKAVLVVDGHEMDTMKFTLNAEEWANLPGTVRPSSGSIVITTPSEDTTPKTEDQKNPSTGANDMVAAAMALMAVSALGAAVLTRKK